jgi:hypothetical protein
MPPTNNNKNWTEVVLYSFKGNSDGSIPIGPILKDSAGNLYGSVNTGGASGWGGIFEVSPPAVGKTAWTKIMLYSFTDAGDGAAPFAIIQASNGNLLGNAAWGGNTANMVCTQYAHGCGVIFELSPPVGGGTHWTEKTLYEFSGTPDGFLPVADSLLIDGKGNIYGTTEFGGMTSPNNSDNGILFELSPN